MTKLLVIILLVVALVFLAMVVSLVMRGDKPQKPRAEDSNKQWAGYYEQMAGKAREDGVAARVADYASLAKMYRTFEDG